LASSYALVSLGGPVVVVVIIVVASRPYANYAMYIEIIYSVGNIHIHQLAPANDDCQPAPPLAALTTVAASFILLLCLDRPFPP
jgi:hypothetical protein